MGKKVRSARGELVDFDLLKIKEQMASAPPPTDVRARQDFIEKRMRRRLKRVSPPAPKVKNNEDIVVEPKMPATEELDVEPTLIDEVTETQEAPGEVQESVPETREGKSEFSLMDEKADVEPEEEPKKKRTRRQRARPLTPPKADE